MMDPSRRSFIKGSAAAAAAFSVAPALQAANADKKVVVGQIGCGNQGRSHTRSLTSLEHVQLAYICDPDAERLGALAEKAEGAKAVSDFRRILDDPSLDDPSLDDPSLDDPSLDDSSVDAVTITAPDHWHTTAALLALDAEKHVYVEKPCSHNLREGRLPAESCDSTSGTGRDFFPPPRRPECISLPAVVSAFVNIFAANGGLSRLGKDSVLLANLGSLLGRMLVIDAGSGSLIFHRSQPSLVGPCFNGELVKNRSRGLMSADT